MSRSKNNGKNNKRPEVKPSSPKEDWLLTMKRTFGSTEKILRRNRKLWDRLINKERRSLDKEEIEKSLQED